jgi:hypothetical protein
LLDPVTYASRWPGWTAFETPTDAEGRRDWIGEIEARIRKGYAEYSYIGYLQSLLSFLKRVEAARRELGLPAQPAVAAERRVA